MGRFIHILRHLFTAHKVVRRAFPSKTLHAIQHAITEGEKQHRAELRIIIEPALPLMDALERTTARGRTHALFSRYRIWDTEENIGVLIYINIAHRAVEIVTDRAVSRVIQSRDWQDVCITMTQGFAQQRYHESTLAGIVLANALLQQHFPYQSGVKTANELSNRPVVLD